MTRLAQLPGLLALTGLLLTAINPPGHGQEGGKMLKKEGKTDDKLLRENRRMMRDGPTDPAAFLRATGDLLAADPVVTSVVATVAGLVA